MLRNIWRWFKQVWQRLRKPPSPPEPPPPPPVAKLTDAEYEAIFLELLEGVSQGWNRAQVQVFLAGKELKNKSFKQRDLVPWLQGFGAQLQESPNSHEQLARRLLLLADLNLGELSKVAGEIGKNLDVQVPPEPPPDDNSEQAEAWYNRGNALVNLGRFEEAIASYDKAIEIKPDDYDAWYGRGGALDDLGRSEEAIASYDKAIEIKPDDHEAWSNRGVALGNLGRSKEAIASYDKAIEIKPDFHQAWYSRGNALVNLGRTEDAIASFDKAIEIKPDNHNAWSNRGVALGNLGRTEDAIASFDKAIEIKPDNHNAWSNRGNALANLGRFEEAIASYDKAIEIKPDFHQAWYSRGNALVNLGQLEEAIAFYDKAIEIKPDKHEAWLTAGQAAGNLSQYQLQSPYLLTLHNAILKQWGYNGEITIYAAGLEQCQQDTHPEGWGWLHHFMGMAHYFQGRRDIRTRHLWREAVKEYNLALQTLTPQAYPERHLEVLQDYLKILFAWEATEKAQQIQRDGTDVFNRLLAECKSPGKKQQLERQFASFRQLTVDITIQSGNPITALELAEQGKNTCLSWFLNIDESPTYSEIQQLLTPTTAILYWHLSPIALHAFLLTPNAETPHLIFSNPTETETQQALEHLERFETWLKTWNEQYNAYRQGKKDEQPQDTTWRDTLPQRLHQLSDILNIPHILTQLQNTPIQTLILIPHRDLHRLPLQALFPHTFTIHYLPSAQIALSLEQQPPQTPSETHLLSIEEPDSISEEDEKPLPALPFAAVESAYICRQLQPHRRIARNETTLEKIEAALINGCQIFHFTGHAGYNFQQPRYSALCLTQKERLRVEKLVKIPLKACQLVCLSACETAITGNETITTEYVGLVSAFLGQGVSRVVSTLWTVQSDASALIMMEFYRLRQHTSDIEALNQAVSWLRFVTAEDLAKWYQAILDELPPDEDIITDFIETQIYNLQPTVATHPTHRPYQDPYHWASFTITGIT